MVKHFSHVGRHKELPLAMAMYAVGILPLINQLQSSDANQVWFADDATAGGCLEQLHEWWVKLNNLGPPFGYFPNPSKTCMADRERETSVNSNTEISEYRSEHYRRNETPWNCSWLEILCCKLPYRTS